MNPLLLTQLILLVVAIGGWLTGKAAHAMFDRKSSDSARYVAELPRMTDTIAFISGAVGILLGLLLSISVSNYQEVQNSVKEYGSSATAAYETAAVFNPEEEALIRHDLICTVNAFISHDWAVASGTTSDGSTQANLWMSKLNSNIDGLSIDTLNQTQAYPILLQSTLDMGHWRQSVLLTSMENIPVVIWIVIFVSIYLLAFLLTLHLADRRGLSRLSFGVAYIALAVTIFALTVLDYPLNDFGTGPAVSSELLVDILKTADFNIPESVIATCPSLPAL